MAYWDFLQMTPENQAAARNTSWGSALKQEIPGSSTYQGYRNAPANVAQGSRVGLGSYLNQGLKSLVGKFQGGSNVGGATTLMRKLAMSPVGTVARGLMSTPAAGIYGTAKMAEAQGNEMMRASDAANAAGLNLEDFITRDGTRISIDPSFYEAAGLNTSIGGDEIQKQVTETENIDPRGMRGISGEVGEYGDKPGEGFNEEMFYQEPGMFDKFKGMFQRPEAKQKEFEAYEASMNPRGWGDFGDYKGRIDDRGKIDIGDPVTGQMILRDKNFDSAFGSGSVQEMIDKKDAWIADRLLSGKKISKALTSYAMNKGLGTFGDQSGMGAGKPRGDPTGYSGPKTYNFNPSIKGTQAFHPSQGQDIPHGTSTSGNFAGKGSGNPFGRAHGGYMRSGYNEGGRVGILAAF